MITILTTTDKQESVLQVVRTVDRLEELVAVIDHQSSYDATTKLLLITNENTIKVPVDWQDTEPPYIFSDTPFSSENLLALIFYKLGNQQRALEFLSEDDDLFNDILVATSIQYGYTISERVFDKVKLIHNQCIIHHYGNGSAICTTEGLRQLYSEAIIHADDPEHKTFLIKHFTNLLLDGQDFEEAESLIRNVDKVTLSENASVALDIQLAHTLIAKLELPYQEEELAEIRELLQNGITFLESKSLLLNAGLLYTEASKIATYQKDFIQSKEYIQQAISIFKEADIPEFLGEAGLQKASLLYAWSKNGSPQYYKAAINAFQDTLKIFKRDSHPIKFAEAHHNLALIYSEIQISEAEKPIWTAFCASSFKEALKVYTQEAYPYEYAMVSHNYGTALMGFPEAKLHNNLAKANDLFENALVVRSAETFPTERALTLANQLELLWLLHNESQQDEAKNYEQMLAKAREIKVLTSDTALIKKADEHLAALEKLEMILN